MIQYIVSKGKSSEYDPWEYHGIHNLIPVVEGANTEEELHQRMRKSIEDYKIKLREEMEEMKELLEELE